MKRKEKIEKHKSKTNTSTRASQKDADFVFTHSDNVLWSFQFSTRSSLSTPHGPYVSHGKQIGKKKYSATVKFLAYITQ